MWYRRRHQGLHFANYKVCHLLLRRRVVWAYAWCATVAAPEADPDIFEGSFVSCQQEATGTGITSLDAPDVLQLESTYKLPSIPTFQSSGCIPISSPVSEPRRSTKQQARTRWVSLGTLKSLWKMLAVSLHVMLRIQQMLRERITSVAVVEYPAAQGNGTNNAVANTPDTDRHGSERSP